jgi:dynein heavy chain, axonemal
MRVFSDRLINDEDKRLFIAQCLKSKDSKFINMESLGDPEKVLFCNFTKYSPDSTPSYEEVKNETDLQSALTNILQIYNETRGKRDSMSLLFFEYMISHLSRVSRIIMKPQGNGLLIGLSGNGRHSVSKLATFINECAHFQIELHEKYGINDWREDLKNVFKGLGIDNKKTVFFFSDKDIKNEVFFEDIDSILNVGELNNLFNTEDLEEIQYELEKQTKKSRVKITPIEAFKKRCKKNLHMVLFMSPAGSQLQLYFRKYPSLVNCTQIDWYLPWPNAALMTVSHQYLS